MAITLDEAKQLKRGQRIFGPVHSRNGLKLNARQKVTSIKTWKTRPDEIEIRTQYGLYTFQKFNENHLHQLSLKENE